MASSTEPRSGLKFGWAVGDNFAPEMDDNLKKIGRVGFHLTVADRDLTAPPGTPADGDAYIVAASATGAWTGHDGEVAVWDANAASWAFYAPSVGWTAYIEDEDVKSTYKVAGWSAGVAC